MNKSSTRGIFLSISLLFSIILIIFPSNVYGEEITVKSIALEETTIMEVTNDSNEEIKTLKIWLGNNFNFKSFKTEKGWVGEKDEQGVITFKSSESIKAGESVKFGVKTDKPSSAINWQALNSQNTQMNIGTAIAGELSSVVKNPVSNSENTGESITVNSNFRIIPNNVTSGSTIRVTGDSFGASQEFDFYINTKKIASFETDGDGHFMTTAKIPENQKAERVDFKVKNEKGEEAKISLRIGDHKNSIPTSANIPLTIKGLPNIIHRGDFLEIFGTAQPESAITSTVKNEKGEIYVSRTAEVDRIGNWELTEPVIIPLDMPFGEYTATISDGRNEITKSWTVESDKKIIITPINLKFEPGEIIKFNGTALPNKSVELVLEDPFGKEITSDVLHVDDSGVIEFEFITTQNTIEGTYTLIATQDKEKEFSYVGLGQLPTIPVNLEFDKLNYKTSENAIITLSGKGSEIISLLIIDPFDKPKGDAISITLQPDGRGEYSIDLKGYASGAYTAVISKGSTQNEEIFTVGLLTGSGEIEINTTKTEYHPGDSILILGDTSPNVLFTITMTNSNGDVIKTKETFSDKNGKISESSFRIPTDATTGTWNLKVQSGSNLDNEKIEVIAALSDGIQVSVEEIDDLATSHLGKQIQIKITGAQQSVFIEIIADDKTVIEELSFPASKDGDVNQPWLIPKDTEPGTYTIKVRDAFSNAETFFEIQ